MENYNKTDPAEVRLDAFAGDIVANRRYDIGYPLNQKSRLIGFYKFFINGFPEAD